MALTDGHFTPADPDSMWYALYIGTFPAQGAQNLKHLKFDDPICNS